MNKTTIFTPYAFEQKTVTSAVQTPTAAKLIPTPGTNCQQIDISVDTNDIRFTVDGTDPSASSGMYLAKNQTPVSIYGDACAKLKMFAVGSDGKVNLTYYF